MKIIQKKIILGNYEYHKKHLQIINVLISPTLTNKEIEVLAAFMSQEKKLIEEDMFNSLTRKIAMRKLKLTSGGLGNHLKSMLEKGFLVKNSITKKITVKETLIPEDTEQGYQFKIIKQEDVINK